MDNLEKAIAQTLIFYDLFNRPLTALEIFKYLPAQKQKISFFKFSQILDSSKALKEIIGSKSGLYYLINRQNLILEREKRTKISQLKWKRLKRISRILFLVPFLRMAALTGSLTFFNSQRQSDFDLLVVVKTGRIWLARTSLTLLAQILGVRRHKSKTADRLCLNCYLTEKSLAIKKEAKPHDFYSAQEYSRLIPLIKKTEEIYDKFLNQNQWLGEFINSFPWPQNPGLFKKIPKKWQKIPAQVLEWILAGKIGESIEKKLGKWQGKRINSQLRFLPDDQIYADGTCLMFHPQSKSRQILAEYYSKKEKLLKI